VSRFVRAGALVVLLSLGATVAVADDTDGLRSQLSRVQSEQVERQAELAQVQAQATDARERLDVAEAELEESRAALAEVREELKEARAELAEARELADEARATLLEVTDRLEVTEAELLDTQILLDNRVRAAFKYGQVSFAEAFVGVRDITDFLNSTTYVSHVMANDKDLVDAVAALVREVETQRAEAQAARVTSEREAARAERATAQVERAEEQQAALTEQVAERRAAQQEALAALQQDAAAISEHLDDLERSEDQVRAQIADAERRAQQRIEAERQRREAERQARLAEEAAREQAARNDGASGGGDVTERSGQNDPGPTNPTEPPPPATSDGWLRPTNGRLTSGYGYRTHPVHGGQRLHAGVDLASPTGSPVRASRDGVVTFVGWMSGYGNTVMVSHGDGLVTLYAHLSSYAVSYDAFVLQGDTLGGVGMTGTATGPHLHFEVRVGGSPQNPCGYIPC
jgi:murein DD-endopeptidase MepM/ murein hydrolase activator NlpD